MRAGARGAGATVDVDVVRAGIRVYRSTDVGASGTAGAGRARRVAARHGERPGEGRGIGGVLHLPPIEVEAPTVDTKRDESEQHDQEQGEKYESLAALVPGRPRPQRSLVASHDTVSGSSILMVDEVW